MRADIDWSGRGLKRLGGTDDTPHARSLDAHDNAIVVIENLNTLIELEELNLSHNRISRINNLHCQGRLRTLNLSHNCITSIEPACMAMLANLEVLDLSHNCILRLAGLSECRKLTVLDLSFNYLDSPGDLSSNSALVEVNLQGNTITTCHDFQSWPTSLRSLYLASNDISALKDLVSLMRFTSLSNLSIDGNAVMDSLRSHQIHTTPFLLFLCPHLVWLDGSIEASHRQESAPLFTYGPGGEVDRTALELLRPENEAGLLSYLIDNLGVAGRASAQVARKSRASSASSYTMPEDENDKAAVFGARAVLSAGLPRSPPRTAEFDPVSVALQQQRAREAQTVSPQVAEPQRGKVYDGYDLDRMQHRRLSPSASGLHHTPASTTSHEDTPVRGAQYSVSPRDASSPSPVPASEDGSTAQGRARTRSPLKPRGVFRSSSRPSRRQPLSAPAVPVPSAPEDRATSVVATESLGGGVNVAVGGEARVHELSRLPEATRPGEKNRESMASAAISVQKAWRGHSTRKGVKEHVRRSSAATSIQAQWRGSRARQGVLGAQRGNTSEDRSAGARDGSGAAGPDRTVMARLSEMSARLEDAEEEIRSLKAQLAEKSMDDYKEALKFMWEELRTVKAQLAAQQSQRPLSAPPSDAGSQAQHGQ